MFVKLLSMLKPEHRLTKVRDFNLLMKNGRWVRGEFLDMRQSVLQLIPKERLPKKEQYNNFTEQLRIAFTVGLSVDKRAVVRNRIKRQMREIVRLLIQDKKIKSGSYFLFVARKTVVEKKYEELQKEIEKLLTTARAMKIDRD
jgi:ribonuclease P protein component